ncbi:FkbM family methyltransferase [Paenibacillus sp. NPDC056722]|uniref:FkbM family methyltransferase n=1 Tax=Paenibacillus sp. NPDC056722 TaxID=3345924 RepID=UPI0036D0D082
MISEIMVKRIFSDTRNVYNNLMDEQSQELFKLRMLFNLTSDWKYIKELTARVPDFSSIGTHQYIDFSIKCQEYISNGKNLIIYGAGAWGEHLYSYLSYGIKWTCFCDKDENKQKDTFCGLPVISPEELRKQHLNDIVVIASLKYKEEIYNELISLGLSSENILTFNSDPWSITTFLNDKQYFEDSIIKPSDNEVFIDAGCFDFGNSLVFQKWSNNNYEKIYAFEPDPLNHENCKEAILKNEVKNVELINAGLWSESTTLHFNADGSGGSSIEANGETNVNVVSLDSFLNGQRASFIKMDIEGAELEALKGAKETILKYRPRLAICIYHKPEDILEIPLYLQSLISDYKFYIRHYSNYTVETVLYAI